MGALRGKGNAKAGSSGFAASLNFSSSASWSLLALALRFWNQILTCVSVRLRELENSALSAMERYCFWRNFLSRESSWEVVKGVLGFLLFLCFRRLHGVGLGSPGSIKKKKKSHNWNTGYVIDIWVIGLTGLVSISRHALIKACAGGAVIVREIHVYNLHILRNYVISPSVYYCNNRGMNYFMHSTISIDYFQNRVRLLESWKIAYAWKNEER